MPWGSGSELSQITDCPLSTQRFLPNMVARMHRNGTMGVVCRSLIIGEKRWIRGASSAWKPVGYGETVLLRMPEQLIETNTFRVRKDAGARLIVLFALEHSVFGGDKSPPHSFEDLSQFQLIGECSDTLIRHWLYPNRISWQKTQGFKPHDFYGALFSYLRIGCKCDLKKVSQVGIADEYACSWFKLNKLQNSSAAMHTLS